MEVLTGPICNLIAINLLHRLRKTIDKNDGGFYKDGALIVLRNCKRYKTYKTQTNLKEDFLDVTLNLRKCTSTI